MVEELISEDEEIISKIGSVYLTGDRVIRHVKSGLSKDYTDIQLEKVTHFDHYSEFNHIAFASGIALLAIRVIPITAEKIELMFGRTASFIPVLIGAGLIAYAFLSWSKGYKIRSENSDVAVEMPSSENVFEFWKRVNQQKNH